LIKQEVTGFFILFITDTTLIDRPIDPSASPVETLLPLVRSQFVIRLSLVFLSFVSRTCRLLRLQSFLIHAAIDSIYTTQLRLKDNETSLFNTRIDIKVVESFSTPKQDRGHRLIHFTRVSINSAIVADDPRGGRRGGAGLIAVNTTFRVSSRASARGGAGDEEAKEWGGGVRCQTE